MNETTLKLDVSVRPIQPHGKCVGLANIKINDCFVVDGFRVMNGENGLFVAMPSKESASGKYYDTARPITKEFREQLNGAVIQAFRGEVDRLRNLANDIPPERMEKQISDGAKQAAKHNAAKPTPTKTSPTVEER